MKNYFKTLAVLLAVGFSGIAQAGNVAVGLKASTLGFGLEATTNVVPSLLNVRLQGNIFNYKKDLTDTGVTYQSKFKLRTAGLLLDVYPFSGKFRLTGGAYYNDNKFDITSKQIGTVTVGGTQYNNPDLNGTVNFNKFAPYIGLGWGDAVSEGSPFGFSFELGALYQGTPKTSITSNLVSAADIAIEKKTLDNAFNKMKWYPVVAFGLNYKF